MAGRKARLLPLSSPREAHMSITNQRTVNRLGVLALAAGTAACGGGGAMSVAGPNAGPTPAPVATPAPLVAAPTARYSVTFEATWSASTHPTDIPADPHFSRLIGGTHAAAARFWGPGLQASTGIQDMAERGAITPLDREIEAAIAAGTADGVFSGGAIRLSPGATSLEFDIRRDFPLVTLVSMVAPSPDWFVGVHDLNLIERGDWVPLKAIPLLPYDAGTDDGVTFGSANAPSQPHQPIHLIEGFPFALGGQVAPLGTFTFRRLP